MRNDREARVGPVPANRDHLAKCLLFRSSYLSSAFLGVSFLRRVLLFPREASFACEASWYVQTVYLDRAPGSTA